MAEWEAAKATVEKFGHRPRLTTDSAKYVVEFRVFQSKETAERLAAVRDRFKLTQADVNKLEADASSYGWKKPQLPPIKDLD